MVYIFLILIIIIIYYLNLFFIKKNIFVNYSGENHQKFSGSKNIPLTGGIFLFFLLFPLIDFEKDLYFFLFLILIIGILSDTKMILSPMKRFLLQSLIILIFVTFSEVYISSTRIIFLDDFLKNNLFNIFFSYFCLIILVNGTNFIDGLNGLVLGYYTIISILILKLSYHLGFVYNEQFILYFISLLFILMIFNFMNKLYLGDNGSYVISLFFGYYLILFYNNNELVSPFFIVSLLWYPCFENLFSVIRKLQINKSPIKPDNKHFHQLLFHFLKSKLKRNNTAINNLTSILINSYNFFVLYLSSIYYFNTQVLLMIIIFNVILYVLIYLRLFRYKFKII